MRWSIVAIVLATCSREVPAPAVTANRAVVAAASSCTAPLEFPPLYPDTFVDQAAAAAAQAGGAWGTEPMRGPLAAMPGDCHEVARLPAAPPFDAIVQCATGAPGRPLGPDNIPSEMLAVQVGAAWWTHDLAHAYWPHGDPDDEPRVTDVRELAAADRLGDGGVEITAIAEDGPPGGAKTRTAILCGVGPSRQPTCARIPLSAGGPFHGAGARVYRVRIGCDGTMDLAGWQGGATVGLVHGSYTIALP